MDRDLRDWIRSLAVLSPGKRGGRSRTGALSDKAADYLERIATDGTLKAALAEISASEPELAG